jgi:hypothetical protein
MDTVTLLREYVKGSHGYLEGTLGDTTPAQAQWPPQGKTSSVAANYAHLVCSEDYLVNSLAAGKAPLFATTMEEKTGLSELPQLGDWSAWARQLIVDLPALRVYAQAVYANTDAFLASLTPADLERTVDLSIFGYGAVPLPLFILTFVGGHAAMHAGEISCVKGLQGLRGYPS